MLYVYFSYKNIYQRIYRDYMPVILGDNSISVGGKVIETVKSAGTYPDPVGTGEPTVTIGEPPIIPTPVVIDNDYKYLAFDVGNVALKTGVCGWRLVRFLPPTSTTWHPIDDNLVGTATYGTAYNYTNAWSIPFETFDEFCFGTLNLQYWMYITKTAAIGANYSGVVRSIIRSSFSATPYTAIQYNRPTGFPEDPWLSIQNYPIQTVYGENSINVNNGLISSDRGMCVWVRNSTAPLYTQYTVNFSEPKICDVLIVGGGGGGGTGHGGGGGAGQLVFIHQATLNGTYNIKVGNKGIGGTLSAFPGTITPPTKGSDSEFGTVIAEGGGANGGATLKDGGSGAGGDGYTPDGGVATKGLKNTTADTFSSGTVYSRGNDGGTGGENPYGQGGGGGGAGAVGGNGAAGSTNASPGNGGNGLSNISEIGYDFKTNFGTNVGKLESDNLIYFAGGGGGGAWDISSPETNSTGGKGGGGAGGLGNNSTSRGVDAVNNTGSGGGGGSASYGHGANGGSGIVIIRYPRTKIPFDAQWTYNTSNANVCYFGNVGIGTTNPTNALHVVGDTFSTTYSGGSKTFKIEHPLKINKWLYHGCIEGPRFDNIYRGKKLIIGGKAEVDIDTECNTTGGMTPGTFPALNTNYQLYLQNNKTFDRVKGTITGSKIQIESQNVIDEIEVDWLVVGERHDVTVINPDFTDSDGNLICEHYLPGYNKYNSGEPERIANIDVTEEYTVSQEADTSNLIIEEEGSNTSNI
jgi:hypothetical protein